jgi:hypothetical protein
VVDRPVEESLDLPGVQIDGDDPVGAGRGEEVRDQAGRDGLATLGLPVLTGVAVVGAHRRDPVGRRPLGGVDHDPLLEEGVVDGPPGRPAVRLDDEYVGAADRLCKPRSDLTVGEVHEVGVTELEAEVLGDALGQVGV